jgi:hypothetical protein
VKTRAIRTAITIAVSATALAFTGCVSERYVIMTTLTTMAVHTRPTPTEFRTVIAMATAKVSTKGGKMTLGT